MHLLRYPFQTVDCNVLAHSNSQAFFQGKLKITGNMGLAMKLQSLQLHPGKAKL